MKDLRQTIDENFDSIRKLLDQGNYSGCSVMSTDLITYSVMSDHSEGIFIGEVFESVFDQIGPLVQMYDIKDEQRNTIHRQLSEQIASLAKSYNAGDKAGMYEALKGMRSTATRFQFDCWRTMKPRPEFGELHVARRRISR